MRKIHIGLFIGVLLLAVGCQVVPSTGDKASDTAAAQQFIPTISGYNKTDATDINDALSKAGIGLSVVTGNIPQAGAIAKLNDMIQCYKKVGAVAAAVYTQANPPPGTVPTIGALAVINTTRVQRDLLACVLNTGAQAGAQSADAGFQPCGGNGTKVVNGETLQYVYGATSPELCTIFQSQFN
jgi:hypothetical protein